MGERRNAIQDDNRRRTIEFRLGEARFEMDAKSVAKVVRRQSVMPCARPGSAIVGLVKIKGRTVPVIDLGTALSQQRSKETAKTRIVVVEGEHGRTAFVVDAVKRVARRKSTPETQIVRGTAVVDMGERTASAIDLDEAPARLV